MLKRILKWLLVLFLILLVWNWKLVLYGINQLKGQLHIVSNSITIEEALAHSSLSDEYKRKLLLIGEIRKYAMDSLGLKNSDNYTTFYDQQNKPVLWVLTACEPFEMKAYQWYFPFLGNVSYKGFFIKEKGEKEFVEIKQKGYDADYSTVSGWSTLGWFTDPVLSNFLKRPDGMLAELIIHELTHATVYVKSNVDYNENLATFIGEQGAEKFLRYKYGNESKELAVYRNYKSDEEIYGNHLLKSPESLDSLYKLFSERPFSVYEKHFLKYKTIASKLLEANNLPLHRKEFYRFKFGKEPLPNNTFFMSWLRYRNKQNDFKKEFSEKYHENLKDFIAAVKK